MFRTVSRSPICIDIDNTVADTDTVMRHLMRAVSAGRVDLDHEDVICYEYWKCRDARGNRLTSEEWKKVVSDFHTEGLLDAQPYEDVVPQLERLKDVFEVHLVTSRDSASAPLTRSWLSQHGIPHDFVHFVRHGEKHRLPIGFSYAVDDDREQAYAFYAIGVPAIVVSQPWNHLDRHSPIERLSGWKTIATRMIERPPPRNGAVLRSPPDADPPSGHARPS